VVLLLAWLPLDPRFAGLNPTEAMDFWGRQKSAARLPSERKWRHRPHAVRFYGVQKKSLRSMNKNISNAKFYSFLRQCPDLLLDVFDCGIAYRAVVDESIVIPCRYHSAIILLAHISPGGWKIILLMAAVRDIVLPHDVIINNLYYSALLCSFGSSIGMTYQSFEYFEVWRFRVCSPGPLIPCSLVRS
jgi:hypothetical protein